MVTPAHLGGNLEAYQNIKNQNVTAEVISADQNDQTRQWSLSVRLRGGRIINGVKPLHQSDGAGSGQRQRLPRKGSRGVVVFTEGETSNDAFFLGTYDAYTFGVDTDTAEEDVNLTPSYYATAITGDGTSTTRYQNGDTFWAGPGLPYRFELRDPDGNTVEAPVRRGERNNYFLSAPGGKLWGLTIAGGLSIIADAQKRKLSLSLSPQTKLELFDGLFDVTARSMRVGPKPEKTVPVALWPEVQQTLEALAREIHELKHENTKMKGEITQLQVQMEYAIQGFGIIPWTRFWPPAMKAVPRIPRPIITRADRTGGLTKGVGAVKVIDAASQSLQGS